MKRTITFLAFALTGFCAKAQYDTLLYENFDVDPTSSYLLFPSGNDIDWVDMDNDGLVDHTAALGPNWVWSEGFIGSNDSTGCLISNSWFNTAAAAANYLITPPIQIVDGSAMLSWKSAPYQTPLYLDGYKVLISTGGNDVPDYTDTVFVAAEYLSGSATNGGNYSAYTFSSGFVHGEDGTYIEYDTDSARFAGVLRPFNVSLAAYAGQTIYIAFLHDSYDDNLLAIDDILVTGTAPVGIKEQTATAKLNLYPNPAKDKLEVNYILPVTAKIIFKIFDAQGKLISVEEKGSQLPGEQHSSLNIKSLASGNYTLQIAAGSKTTSAKFTKVD